MFYGGFFCHILLTYCLSIKPELRVHHHARATIPHPAVVILYGAVAYYVLWDAPHQLLVQETVVTVRPSNLLLVSYK